MDVLGPGDQKNTDTAVESQSPDTSRNSSSTKKRKYENMVSDAHSSQPDYVVESEGALQMNENHVSLMDSEEKREKALKFIEEIVQRTLYYSEYVHKRMVQAAAEKEKKMAVEQKRKSTKKGQSQDTDEPILFTGGKLFPHQVEGFQWLKTLYDNGINSILADEMGLGKTAQAVAIISYLVEKGLEGPYFVCAPLSTLDNWRKEFEMFAPEVPVVLYHGSKSERAALRSNLNTPVQVRNMTSLPVFISNYETVLADCNSLSKVRWKYFVIDEGHRIKNHQSQLFRVLKTFDILNMLIMTGTPLQNNLSELWALLNKAIPQIFNDMEGFQSLINVATMSSENANAEIASQEKKDKLITKIHQVLTPFFLRRTKRDVNLQLPPKKEIIVYAPLTTLQKQYYDATVDKTITDLLKKDASVDLPVDYSPHGRPKRARKSVGYQKFFDDFPDEDELDELNPANTATASGDATSSKASKKWAVHLTMTNITMMLRKVCMHPYLICRPICPKSELFTVDEELVKCSGKLRVLDAMLPELKKGGHKVLIFTQMVRMLEILVDYCSLRNFSFNRIDGQIALSDRITELQNFRENPSSFIFLLSTKAGGLGLNLTSADTVIVFDSDWNPQCDLQAQDRCHRIGQTKPVVVYRLVCKNTIDEYMVNKAVAKRKLEKLIITDGRFSTSDTLIKSQEPMTEKELLELLRSCEIKEAIDCNNEKILSKKELKLLLDRSDLENKGSHRDIEGLFKVVH